MHKDQTRVMEVALPAIASRIHDDTPEGQRDCTVLNRMLVQGPDPLFIMESSPDVFADLCTALGLTVEDGMAAVESAHWQGPGCLLEGTGLPEGLDAVGDPSDTPKMWRLEALWLVLASMSDCTEEGYTEETALLTRIRRAVKATNALATFVAALDVGTSFSFGQVMNRAVDSLEKFVNTTEYEMDDKGIPHATEDHSFYVLYKKGFKCVAVHTDGPIFYGTTPDTTLEECGVQVDKELSPNFGLVFP